MHALLCASMACYIAYYVENKEEDVFFLCPCCPKLQNRLVVFNDPFSYFAVSSHFGFHRFWFCALGSALLNVLVFCKPHFCTKSPRNEQEDSHKLEHILATRSKKQARSNRIFNNDFDLEFLVRGAFWNDLGSWIILPGISLDMSRWAGRLACISSRWMVTAAEPINLGSLT